MDGRADANPDLHSLLAEPVVRRRWPAGLTTDDILDELHGLGRLHVRVEEAASAVGRPTPRYTCAIELREGGVGLVVGRGRTLTVAALRCLVDVESELDEEVRRGLTAFDDLLDTA
jgi:hypothetical protein